MPYIPKSDCECYMEALELLNTALAPIDGRITALEENDCCDALSDRLDGIDEELDDHEERILELEQGGGGGGTTNHQQLTNRNAADCHPISSITGLEDELDSRTTESEVLALILDELSRFEHLDYQIVDTLPATGEPGVRYLVPHATDDHFEEYIYVDNRWRDIGSSDSINLDDYYTKTEVDSLLDDKADAVDVPVFTLQTTDPGEGVALAANHFICVYNA